ncbi:MAG TPA: carboxypeptidase-like regulatory domain-containing protein, partial [Bryobacteraceae bacterium]|nr:carboxypeptidase-like regulatory domain-containing protein [Bryobacteraceae bacterium]
MRLALNIAAFARAGRSALLALSLAALALGQGDRGTITGTVVDQQSAVMPGATVIARHRDTGSEHRTVVTETGNYTLPSLPAGRY